MIKMIGASAIRLSFAARRITSVGHRHMEIEWQISV